MTIPPGTLTALDHANRTVVSSSPTLTNWIGIGAAVATLVLGFFTWKMAQQAARSADETRSLADATKDMVKQAVRSADETRSLADATKDMATATQSALAIEQQGLVQSRDALMPVLELLIIPADVLSTPEGKSFMSGRWFATLHIHNHGPGPAFIREFTMRDEIDWGELFDSPLRHAVVPSHDKITLPLQFKIPCRVPNQESISSFSVWYDDVYGRHYRSRIVFIYNQKGDPNQNDELRIVSRLDSTFQRDGVPNPHFTYHASKPVDHLAWAQEGGLVIPSIGLDRAWYQVNVPEDFPHDWCPGAPATNNQRYQILSWGFWLSDGYPQIVIRVESHAPFAIIRDPSQAENLMPEAQRLRVCSAEEFQTSRTNLRAALKDPQTALFSDWGLRNQSTLPNELLDLYNLVRETVNEGLTRIDADAPPAPGPSRHSPTSSMTARHSVIGFEKRLVHASMETNKIAAVLPTLDSSDTPPKEQGYESAYCLGSDWNHRICPRHSRHGGVYGAYGRRDQPIG